LGDISSAVVDVSPTVSSPGISLLNVRVENGLFFALKKDLGLSISGNDRLLKGFDFLKREGFFGEPSHSGTSLFAIVVNIRYVLIMRTSLKE